MTTPLLTAADQNEGLFLAYVNAPTTHKGFWTGVPEPDRGSVDVRIMAGGPPRLALDLRVKATADVAETQGGFSRFD